MITVISGTNRPESNTHRVAEHVVNAYKEMGSQYTHLDLSELPSEIFTPEAYAKRPAGFEPFVEKILTAQGLVVVTPEYNGSMPGVLKYFIDMLPFPESFERKPVCYVGLSAGRWGALRAIEQLEMIFGYRNAFIYPERVFIPGIMGEFDEGGNFKNPEYLERIQKQAKGFLSFTESIKNV